MRLLMIDDSRLDRTRIKRLINQMNADISVAEAQDVPTALGMVAVEQFDCILIDYRLPGADGVELAHQIGASHEGVKTPMVMLTGEPSEGLAEHAISSGLTDFLGKRNLSAEHLRQTLFNAMIKHRTAHQASMSKQADDIDTADPSRNDRQAIVEAMKVLDRSGLFKEGQEGDQQVAAALRTLRKATATLTH